MTIADIHISKDKFFVLIDECIYIQINNREKQPIYNKQKILKQ